MNKNNFNTIPLDQCSDESITNESTKKLKTENDKSNETLIKKENILYKQLNYHWFYSTHVVDKLTWKPVSYKDSYNLEKIYKNHLTEIKILRKKTMVERCDYLKRNKLNLKVSIKGGRFEADLIELVKRPVYWNEEKKSEVRRCLWFYKEYNEQLYLPYDEEYSEFLEIEYEKTIKSKCFHKRIDYLNRLNDGKKQNISCEEAFVFHSTTVMLHFTQARMLDEYGNLNSDAKRPRVVKRGLTDLVDKVEPDEIENIDHLCFVVHGIGDGCDLRFRPLVECVDDFRNIGAYMIQSHLKNYIDLSQMNGRVEFLPISWHNELHGNSTGVDTRLSPITLSSIPKLRQYSNTTILDVLFYTSPIYCQTIINQVGNELNRLTQIFLERNPYFKGKISLIGHSLGSLILFDLLSHQIRKEHSSEQKNSISLSSVLNRSECLETFLKRLNLIEYQYIFENEKITLQNLCFLNESDFIQLGIPLGPRRILLNEFKNDLFKREQKEVEKKILLKLETLKRHELDQRNEIELKAINLAQNNMANDYKYGLAGTGQLLVKYPQLNFKVAQFYAIGSPIAMFLTVRGIEKLGTNFKFPTCDEFFNIFHPFDPVAYRFEPLIFDNAILGPVLMPHHKGRKRMHLELKENLTKVGEDLKQRIYDQINKAWSSISDFAKLSKVFPNGLISKVIEKFKIEDVSVSDPATSTSTTKTNIIKQADKSESTIPFTTNLNDSTEFTNNNHILNEKDNEKIKVDLGKLNQNKRIDYVLQERPIESFNEYLFALASHVCYWESEDTLLMIVKELYGLSNSVDSNTELQLTEQQQKASSWLTQAAAATLSFNIRKTL